MTHFTGKKVLVLGLGDTGWSMARWLARHGARVSVADSRTDPPFARELAQELPGVPLATGAFEKASFSDVDTIAISPGIDRREPLVSEAIRRGVPVVGDIEIFAQALAEAAPRDGGRVPHVIAITGSNGKSTVTAMAGEVSRAAGRSTVVAGNIGLPVLDALGEIEVGGTMPDVFVLELSSFQLESTSSLNADAASVLNVSEDHLDRYEGIADYAAAKARIFEGTGVQVLNRLDRWSMSMARAGREQRTVGVDAARGENEWGIEKSSGQAMLARGSEILMPAAELPLAGRHNALNALATLALADAIWLPTAPSLEALRRFRGLPHRMEKVTDIGGIAFYDDSKGTNVGATVAALNGMTMPVALIAGGDGKGQDFAPLAPAVKAHAKAVVLIGRDADAIHSVLAGCGVPLLRAREPRRRRRAGLSGERPGDAVLLSPACASYDMFRSYVHRARSVRRGGEEPRRARGRRRPWLGRRRCTTPRPDNAPRSPNTIAPWSGSRCCCSRSDW